MCVDRSDVPSSPGVVFHGCWFAPITARPPASISRRMSAARGSVATWYVVKNVARTSSAPKNRDSRGSALMLFSVIPVRAGTQLSSSVSTETTTSTSPREPNASDGVTMRTVETSSMPSRRRGAAARRGGRATETAIERLELAAHRGAVESSIHAAAAPLPHGLAAVREPQHRTQGCRETLETVRGDPPPELRGGHPLVDPTHIPRYHRQSGRHGFKNPNREPFGAGREEEHSLTAQDIGHIPP